MSMEYDKLEKRSSTPSSSSIHTLHDTVHAHHAPYTPSHSAHSSINATATRARHGHHHTRSDSHHFTSAHSHSGSGGPLSNPSRRGYFDDVEEEKDRRRAGLNAIDMSPKNIGRAIGARFVRAVKRGNLPFMLVFTIALLVFVGALAGVGYVDPSSPSPKARPTEDQQFEPGQPVFDAREAQAELEKQMTAQRALEQQWRRAARPNAGAWMRDHRDDGSRKQAEISPEEAEAIAAQDAEKLRLHERNLLRGLESARLELADTEQELLAEIKLNNGLLTKLRRLQDKADAEFEAEQAKLDAEDADAGAGAAGGPAGGEKKKLAPPKMLINPKTHEHDERLGMSAADIRSKDGDLQKSLAKLRENILETDTKLAELRRRVEAY